MGSHIVLIVILKLIDLNRNFCYVGILIWLHCIFISLTSYMINSWLILYTNEYAYELYFYEEIIKKIKFLKFLWMKNFYFRKWKRVTIFHGSINFLCNIWMLLDNWKYFFKEMDTKTKFPKIFSLDSDSVFNMNDLN